MTQIRTSDSPPPIRLGLVGVGGYARVTNDLIAEMDDVQVVAVADLDRERCEAAAEQFAAKPFVDVRSMIVESPLDAVIMSLPNFAYPEYVRLAAQRGLHLLKEKPLGRNFEEGLKMVDAFAASGKVFMVGTQRRFAPPLVRMKQALAEIGRPVLVRSHFLMNFSGDFGWRGDRSKAGFGAMGDLGYHNIDLLNWMLGPPQDVYAMQTGRGREDAAHPYDTDDTGVAMLHYSSGLIGYLVCSYVAQPWQVDVVIHGSRGTLTASPEQFTWLDSSGKVVEQFSSTFNETRALMMRRKVRAFIDAIRASGGAGAATGAGCSCSAGENLINQAVIDAMYLSGRTSQSQAPSRIFELHNRTMAEFMPRKCDSEATSKPRG